MLSPLLTLTAFAQRLSRPSLLSLQIRDLEAAMRLNVLMLIETLCASALNSFKRSSLLKRVPQAPARTEHPKTLKQRASASHHQTLMSGAHVINAPSEWKETKLIAHALNHQESSAVQTLKMVKARRVLTLATHRRTPLRTA